MNREQLGDAIREYVRDNHGPQDGEIVTDYVVIAGWVDATQDPDDDRNGVHLITSAGTPGYTSRGLLATAARIWDSTELDGDD